MGFDLYGVNPQSKAGEYFRANVWGWRPIHCLIAETQVLGIADLVAIGFNDGHTISEDKAIAIATALEVMLDNLPDECVMPSPLRVNEGGRFLRDDEAGGKSPYSIGKDDIREFITFCRESGGFEVC